MLEDLPLIPGIFVEIFEITLLTRLTASSEEALLLLLLLLLTVANVMPATRLASAKLSLSISELSESAIAPAETLEYP